MPGGAQHFEVHPTTEIDDFTAKERDVDSCRSARRGSDRLEGRSVIPDPLECLERLIPLRDKLAWIRDPGAVVMPAHDECRRREFVEAGKTALMIEVGMAYQCDLEISRGHAERMQVWNNCFVNGTRMTHVKDCRATSYKQVDIEGPVTDSALDAMNPRYDCFAWQLPSSHR